MNNIYAGPTITALGASYLDSRTVLEVREGFSTGNSRHLVYLGEYETQGFDNKGVFNQTIQLSATDKSERLGYNSDFQSREIQSVDYFYDEFDNEAIFASNWNNIGDQSWGITGLSPDTLKGFLRSTTSTNSVMVRNDFEYSDAIIDFNIRADQFANPATTQRAICGLRAQNPDRNDFSGYTVQYIGNNTGINIQRNMGGNIVSGTTIASVNIGLTPLFNYYTRIIQYQDRIDVFFGTSSFQGLSRVLSVRDNTFGKGSLSFYNVASSGVTAVLNLFNVKVDTIAQQNTNERTLKYISKTANINESTFSNSFVGTSGFYVASSGNSWMTGNSINEITNVGLSATDSYYMSTGTTFDNFILECEVKGISNASGIGTLVGTSSSFYSLGLQFGASITNNTNKIIHRLGSNTLEYPFTGNHLAPKPGLWYNLKLVKSNLLMAWFLEDTLVGSIYGTSLASVAGVNNSIGFYVQGASNIGTFRNIRISEFSQLQDSTIIQTNQTVKSALNRYLPDGYDMLTTGSTFEFINTGNSRGSIDINGSSQFIINSTQETENGGKRVLAMFGENSLYIGINDNSRVDRQVDSMMTGFINETSIKSQSDSKIFVNQEFRKINYSIDQVNLSLNNLPRIQKYDKMNVVDTTLGISGQYTVYSFTKNFTPDNFKIKLVLGK